jgi:predicted dehydrogenase
MTDQPLRWGLLSTAKINEALLEPLRNSKRNTLAAVASRSQATADAYAKANKIKKAYGSYEALLADPEIDVIYNPLPNHMHAEWTINAVEAGKHVLVEKPIALTVAEVEAMDAAAQKNGRVVAEAFMYRHHPQTIKVVEMVNDGKLGAVKFVRGTFTIQFNREGNYRFDPAQGGGALWDVGCYPLSFTRAALGAEPIEVFGWQVTGATGIDETFVAQMRFPGEIYAQFDCSFVLPFRATMEVVGSKGRLSVPTPFKPDEKEHIVLTHPNGTTDTMTIHGQPLYSGEVEDMADAVLLGKTPRVSLADSRANVATILALFESARIGKPVTM